MILKPEWSQMRALRQVTIARLAIVCEVWVHTLCCTYEENRDQAAHQDSEGVDTLPV